MIGIDLFFFFAGLFLLYIGAEFLVRGSSRIALLFRISPVIVGLTVVAFGTSSPEFLVSMIAAYGGNTDVAVGNIVGSNIANIGLILGVSGMLYPISVALVDIKKELYWMLGVSVLFWFFAMNNVIGFWEGAVFIAGIVLFTTLLVRQSYVQRKGGHSNNPDDTDVPKVKTGIRWIDNLSRTSKLIIFGVYTIAGIIFLAWGSRVTIDAAIRIANTLGISQVVIGLTMVAFGTSLPELATSIISVIKKENEILVGNVVGSNIFNVLAVAGPVSTIFPMPIQNEVIRFDFPVMLLFSVFLCVVMFMFKKIGRVSALILLLSYVGYIAWLVYYS